MRSTAPLAGSSFAALCVGHGIRVSGLRLGSWLGEMGRMFAHGLCGGPGPTRKLRPCGLIACGVEGLLRHGPFTFYHVVFDLFIGKALDTAEQVSW